MSDYQLDSALIWELWDSLKGHIPEKQRAETAKEMLVTLEDHDAITYETMAELKEMDQYLEEAFNNIYKEDDVEEEDFDEFDEFDE